MSDKDLIKEISLINFKAGDTIVISCDQMLRPDQRKHISDMVSHVVDRVKVMVLDGGLKMSVASETLSIPPIETTIFDGEKMRELGDKIKSSSDV